MSDSLQPQGLYSPWNYPGQNTGVGSQYWFCHTLTWIQHGCTCDPKHEPPSHFPPHNIPLGHPRAPAPSRLEGLMLKLQYFGYLMRRADSFEKILSWKRLREGGEGDDRGWDCWIASPTEWTRSLSKLQETVKDREAWHTVVLGIAELNLAQWLNNYRPGQDIIIETSIVNWGVNLMIE